MIWRLASAQLIAARIAPRYSWPMSDLIGAQASSRSGSSMPNWQAAIAMRFRILGADLVAEAARAAVDADHDVVQLQTEGLGGVSVIQLGDALHFEVVVAAAERADLVALALLGVIRDVRRARASRIWPCSSVRSRSFTVP